MNSTPRKRTKVTALRRSAFAIIRGPTFLPLIRVDPSQRSWPPPDTSRIRRPSQWEDVANWRIAPGVHLCVDTGGTEAARVVLVTGAGAAPARNLCGARQGLFGGLADTGGGSPFPRHGHDFHLAPVVRKLFSAIQADYVRSGHPRPPSPPVL